MRHYPYWQHGHGDYRPPQAIRRLPFELLRSQRYPGFPHEVADAAEDYADGAPLPLMYLPQRMAFSRYKTPPYAQGYGENVRGALDAIYGAHVMERRLLDVSMGHGHVPHLTMQQAGDYFTRLPEPNVDPAVYGVPVGRNALPWGRIGQRMQDPAQVNAVIRRTEQQAIANRTVRQVQKERAMREVGLMGEQIQDILTHRGSAPWFLR